MREAKKRINTSDLIAVKFPQGKKREVVLIILINHKITDGPLKFL